MSAARDGEKRVRQGAGRGFSTIVLGTVVGQIVTFFALPVLSRFYTPDQFGVLTFALVLAGAIAPFALLGFDQAVIQPPADRDVAPLVWTALSTLLGAALVLAGVIAWTPLVESFPGALRPFLTWSLPLLLFVTGVALLFSQLAVRSGRYSSIGGRNSAQSLTITATQLAFIGTSKTTSFNGLVGGAVIGTSAGALLLLPFAKRYQRRVRLHEVRSSVRRFWRFPVVFAPMTSITLLSQQAPALFALFAFGATAGGYVGMAERIVAVPLALIGLAAGSVFSGELSHALRSDSPHKERIFLRTSAWLCIPAIGVALGLLLLAQPLLPLFLGADWTAAAAVAQAMAVVSATRMVTNPTRAVFRILERARILSIVELVRVALLALAMVIAVAAGLSLLVSLTLLFSALALADVITWACAWWTVRRASAPLSTAGAN
ncbi:MULTISPECIES: lipopolysaccharide biosynthesis protein [unclassified Microbacterium]|uniref:lipopolysaccharide biosynthesis protein n=1 Tax=unclassified Microbacterium TaxID=2609290 RepID=UPI0004939C3E|nr:MULTISPECIES: oligosaccharide flippase family protein [unclassified Microbacterium]